MVKIQAREHCKSLLAKTLLVFVAQSGLIDQAPAQYLTASQYSIYQPPGQCSAGDWQFGRTQNDDGSVTVTCLRAITISSDQAFQALTSRVSSLDSSVTPQIAQYKINIQQLSNANDALTVQLNSLLAQIQDLQRQITALSAKSGSPLSIK